jgi:predicted 3-demethylubiquinone-9 3-methyltransferase (glyoxalase superfamily)
MNNQQIIPCLWFDSHAEEAMTLYTSAFKNSRIESIKRYPDEPTHDVLKGQEGKVLTGIFNLAGYRFMCLDGGPVFQFTPAVSYFVNCDTEAELDDLWAKLSEGGMVMMPLQKYPFSEKFGWLADKFGLSWQLNLVQPGKTASKITPFLMFVGDQHGNAEDAMKLYTSLFANSHIERIERYGEGEDGQPGTVKQGAFRLNGQDFIAMDSNFEHNFTFTGASSFHVWCDTQEQIDHFWNALSANPEAEQCGWLQDKFGVSWQIVPTVLPELLEDPDPVKANNVMNAMLQMKKLNIAELQQARELSSNLS